MGRVGRRESRTRVAGARGASGAYGENGRPSVVLSQSARSALAS